MYCVVDRKYIIFWINPHIVMKWKCINHFLYSALTQNVEYNSLLVQTCQPSRLDMRQRTAALWSDFICLRQMADIGLFIEFCLTWRCQLKIKMYLLSAGSFYVRVLSSVHILKPKMRLVFWLVWHNALARS